MKEKTASMKHYAKKKSMGLCVYGGCHKKALIGGLKCMQHSSKRAKKIAINNQGLQHIYDAPLSVPLPPPAMNVMNVKVAFWKGVLLGIIITSIVWTGIAYVFLQ